MEFNKDNGQICGVEVERKAFEGALNNGLVVLDHRTGTILNLKTPDLHKRKTSDPVHYHLAPR
jgi:hypothetical protein